MFRPYSITAKLLLGVCVLLAPGCGSSDAAPIDDTSPPPQTTLTGLAFESQETITMEPGTTRRLRVVATPPGFYELSFALTGSPLNASLDRSTAVTDSDGVAEVSVTAATDVASFGIRAAANDVVANLAISVSDEGFATLEVTPAYSGRRFISYWVASAHTNSSCSELVGTPPPDATLYAQSPYLVLPTLTTVPVGARVAVTLRAGHYIGGCAEVDGLMRNSVHRVTVPVVDRPIQLDATNLALSLDTAPDARAMVDAARAHVDDTVNALLGDSDSDVDALLDAMNDATTNATGERAFADARVADDWDATVRAVLEPSADTAIRDRVRAWMLAGTETLAGDDLFTGRIVAQGSQTGEAQFLLDTVAGLPAARVRFVPDNPSSWTADPADKVVLASAITWEPTLLLAELSVAPALDEVSEAASVPAALAAQLSCASVAEAIAGASATAPESYADCNADCTAWLCEAALTKIWQRVSSGAGAAGSFALTATGTAQVDDEARPAKLEGSWAGTLTTTNVGISLAGSASGAAPAEK